MLEPSATGSEGNCHRFEVSPNGRLRLDIDGYEVRPCEWFDTLGVTDLQERRQLFVLQPYAGARYRWTGPERLEIDVGMRGRRAAVTVEVVPEDGLLIIKDTDTAVPFARAQKEIERAISKAEALLPFEMPTLPQVPTPDFSQPRQPINWKGVLIGLIFAVLFVGAVAAVSIWWNERNPAPQPFPTATPLKDMNI